MRTKALILSAMLGIAGVASSFAQNVYSVNVVGYMTLTLTNEFSLIANQLDDGAGNLATNLFAGVPNLTSIYKYNGVGYDSATWNQALNRWVGTGTGMSVAPGEGVFVRKPAALPSVTITFVGEVLQGTLVNPVVTGFDIYSPMVPQEGGIVAVHNYVPANQDTIYRFVNGGYRSSTWNALLNPPRWVGTAPSEPVLSVGEAVFINSRTTKDWTRTFNVN